MRFTARELFRRCIAASFLGCGLVAVALAQEAVPPAQPPVLPETEVEAPRPTATEPLTFDDQRVFDPVVDGYRFGSPLVRGYRAGSSTTGSIIDVPDIDLPATVNVIPRDLIRDQQALQFKDIARNAGGVVVAPDARQPDRIFLRGMEVTSRDFRKDGFYDPTIVPRDFQNIERVEILKGPASTLYGATGPGGMVNLITKKPLDDAFVDFNFTVGSYGQERYTLDANGWGTESGDVMYRINIAEENVDSFRDFGYTNRTLIAPSVTWEINENTRLTWLGEWHKDHRRPDFGIPSLNGN
ncbi:MAG TPA: TonB-dependent receptor plug domain-containing protein, partial [Pirellulaceae bacterium]|nr:TonB-dependent receptor plug domain-containing protein [Pirellulaceae bacterium]